MTHSVQLRIQIPEAMVEKFRQDYFEDDWWHDTVDSFFEQYGDQFTEHNKIDGMNVDPWEYEVTRRPRRNYNVEFDLFRQGEYVYFPCSVTDWTAFLTARNLQDQFPIVLRYHQYGQGNDLEISTGHHYNSCTFSVECETHNVGWNWNGMDETTCELMDTWLFEELEKLKELVQDECQALFDKLQEDLEAEYEWLTGDEYITDMIYANYSHDDIVEWCLDHDEPVEWRSASC